MLRLPQKAARLRRTVASPAAQRSQSRDNGCGSARLRKIPRIEHFLKLGHILPVAFALGFLAANQVGQREERKAIPGNFPFLTPGVKLVKGWQEMIAQPEF